MSRVIQMRLLIKDDGGRVVKVGVDPKGDHKIEVIGDPSGVLYPSEIKIIGKFSLLCEEINSQGRHLLGKINPSNDCS